MRKALAGYTIKNLLQRKHSATPRKFINWSEARSITLILEQENPFSRHEIDSFLKGLDKHIEVMFINLKAKTPEYGDWTCYTRKDLNLLGMPKRPLLQQLQKQRCDLVINTAMKNAAFSSAIASAITSSCVCSANDHLGHGDLHIKRRDDQVLTDYLRQVIHYLKMIRST